MKVVILAGGLGTRLSEETDKIPKPMVQIGGKPMLWHIMKIYAEQGFKEFIICGGYKVKEITDWVYNTPECLDFKWDVIVADTGLNTMTGGRIKQIQELNLNNKFFLTYGDGVADIDLGELVAEHKSNGNIVTVTASQPTGRFGGLKIEPTSDFGGQVIKFEEKPKDQWINGGFFVCEPEVFEYIKDDSTIFEKEPLELLASQGNLGCYFHRNFWKCCDTLKDLRDLNQFWNENKAEWKIWK